MENIFYVYEWIRLDTMEPFYVGKGFKNRAYISHRSRYFNNVLNKVGIENVMVSILEENLTEKEALEYEVYYIDLYSNDYGFNLTNLTCGGEGIAGYRYTEEQRKNHSLRLKGRYLPPLSESAKLAIGRASKGRIPSQETKDKISNSRKGKALGERNCNYGGLSESHKIKLRESSKNMSEEKKENIRQALFKANYGRTLSEETRKKISEKNKGRIKTKEEIEKLKDRRKEKNPMYGKHHTDESKRRMSEKLSGANNGISKSVRCIFHDGRIIEFGSLNEMFRYFKKEYGISQVPLSKLIVTKEEYNPRLKKHESLRKLRCEFI